MGALLSVVGLGFLAPFFTFVFSSDGTPDRNPIIHFAAKPAILTVKKGGEGDDLENLSFQTLVQTRCPSLYTKFRPLWWLFNGHLQTIYCVLGDFSKRDMMWYNRTYLRLADGGTIGLDFAPLDDPTLPDDTPIIVVQHGLTGGSYEPYVRAILHRACASVKNGGLGYRAVVCNYRGCAGVPVTSSQLYCAGYTDDLRQAVFYIAHKYPKAPLLGLGFSLGANILTRYLAEEGSRSRIISGCALACPWDLERNNKGLLSSFLGKHVYLKAMGGNFQSLLRRHEKELQADLEHIATRVVPSTLALLNPTLEQVDDIFTRVAGGPAPTFPFSTVDEYYRWGSSHNVVQKIGVPFLAINADDDPIVSHVPMDDGGNGLIVMGLTRSGGHLGWFQAGLDGSGSFVDRWSTKPVLEWLKLTGEDIVHSTATPSRRLYVDEEGWLREEGTYMLGCKMIAEGGVFNGNGGEQGMLQGL